MLDAIYNFLQTTGIAIAMQDPAYIVKLLIMYVIVGVLFYLAIAKKFEPLLLLSISFGMLLANLPGANLIHTEFFINSDPNVHMTMVDSLKLVINEGGLLDFLYLGVKLGIYPSLIFMGVGAMTDFTPLISNPKSLILGAAAQFGVFAAFIGALLIGFVPEAAAAIGIIGGADGPTAILVTKELAPQLLGAIAIAAYSYMALIPIIQPPFMKLLTTKKEREIVMENLRPVSKTEKVLFPIIVTAVVALILPDATPLVGFLMLGNLFTVCGVTERLSKTAQNELMNIVTIFLGVSVGATANAENFLSFETIAIICLGLAAFCFSTIGGLLLGKLMCLVTGGKINPLIGSAGVSAVPMAARVSQIVGQQSNPSNFLLMHAMGPNVAGVIGSAVAAGVFLARFGG
nr:sodium ion-translocating decarboxylase subunit beta [Clostridia bacterium]